MNIVDSLSTPVSAIINLNSFGMVTSAKQQLRTLNLGELLLVTDYFTRHDRLNQIGDITMEKIKHEILISKEYKVAKYYLDII